MKQTIKFVVLLSVSLMLYGCVEQAGVRYGSAPAYREGPPPHAPAHGYRYKYRNHDLRYDSKLGAYVVIGWQDYFYQDGLYFHYLDGRWLFSARLDSKDWRDARYNQVPPNLYRSRERNEHRDKKVPPGQLKKWQREHEDDDYDR